MKQNYYYYYHRHFVILTIDYNYKYLLLSKKFHQKCTVIENH